MSIIIRATCQKCGVESEPMPDAETALEWHDTHRHVLTRSDFEALLWNHLHKSLPARDDFVLLAQCGITPNQWRAFTAGERAEFRSALDLVRSETARKVWDVNA